MFISLNSKYDITVHYSVLFNIELILKDYRILYICEYEDIFLHLPQVTTLAFKKYDSKWFIYKKVNNAKIYTSNPFLLGICLNYIEPSFLLNDKKLVLNYYICVDNLKVFLYNQCISQINAEKIIKQVNQINEKFSVDIKTIWEIT